MKFLNIPTSDEVLRIIYRTEIAVSGRSRFEDTPQDRIISILSLSIGLISFLYYFNDSMGMELGTEITELDRFVYSIGSSFFTALAIWVVCLSLLKLTIVRTTSAAILGTFSAFISALLVEMALEILLLEMRWDIVWSN